MGKVSNTGVGAPVSMWPHRAPTRGARVGRGGGAEEQAMMTVPTTFNTSGEWKGSDVPNLLVVESVVNGQPTGTGAGACATAAGTGGLRGGRGRVVGRLGAKLF